jgi:hypothetical protein
MLYVVKYSGPFGFINPWTAVRDEETFSQQFPSPSIIGGIERKLFPELLKKGWGIYKIKRHRITYSGISEQKEVIQARGLNKGNIDGVKYLSRGTFKNNKINFSTLTRGVMVNPVLFLAFDNIEDAEIAATQHICLARNEDILYPQDEIVEVSEEEFDTDDEQFYGFELIMEESEQSFLVGYNRMDENKPMYGWLKIVGNPVKNEFK